MWAPYHRAPAPAATSLRRTRQGAARQGPESHIALAPPLRHDAAMLTFDPGFDPLTTDPRRRDPRDPFRVIRRLLGWPPLREPEPPKEPPPPRE